MFTNGMIQKFLNLKLIELMPFKILAHLSCKKKLQTYKIIIREIFYINGA